jgi:hypothetical protein
MTNYFPPFIPTDNLIAKGAFRNLVKGSRPKVSTSTWLMFSRHATPPLRFLAPMVQ